MIVETERLRLRPLQESDAPCFAAYRQDPVIARYQSWDIDYSLTDAIDFIRETAGDIPCTPGEWFQFAIADLETDDLLGDIGVFFDKEEAGNLVIGFTLARPNQGKGIAAEALAALLEALATRFELRRVEAYTDVRNNASQALLQRLGFEQVKKIVKSGFFKGEWCDEFLYEKTFS